MSRRAVVSARPPRRTVATAPRRPARPATLGARVYQQLRDSIVSLEIAPGAPVPEVAVCRRLGASRTPVRTAIARLQREGFFTVSGGGAKRRLVVSPLTADDMQQLFLMVGALDGVAARLAARLDDAPRQALVSTLTALNDRLRAVAAGSQAGNAAQVADIDHRFHRTYHAAALAPQLMLELEALGARRARYVRVYTEALLHARNLRDSVAEHDAIIAALRAGDADAAEQSAAFNHRNALERFGPALAAAGERGTWFSRRPPVR